jgi:hypothetical protein
MNYSDLFSKLMYLVLDAIGIRISFASGSSYSKTSISEPMDPYLINCASGSGNVILNYGYKNPDL